jgi:hypothetical protein
MYFSIAFKNIHGFGRFAFARDSAQRVQLEQEAETSAMEIPAIQE